MERTRLSYLEVEEKTGHQTKTVKLGRMDQKKRVPKNISGVYIGGDFFVGDNSRVVIGASEKGTEMGTNEAEKNEAAGPSAVTTGKKQVPVEDDASNKMEVSSAGVENGE